MSRVVRCDGGPKRADASFYVLPDRPGIKRATERAALACSARCPASSVRGPGMQRARPGMQHGQLHFSVAASRCSSHATAFTPWHLGRRSRIAAFTVQLWRLGSVGG